MQISAIQIDASAHCQLACPACPTASRATFPAMGSGHLDPATFQSLLDANPGLLEVELSNYGEMFLNPKLPEILRIAYERAVVPHADNGVNLNHASDEVLEALVRYRVRSITVSIDGASPESYGRYRVRGDYERVIGHIRKLNRYKLEGNSVFPLLNWQFIVFGHNEDEITKAKHLAAELGMSFRPKISWDDEVSPIRNKELVRIQTGHASTREEHRQTRGVDYLRSICHQLWRAPVLNWDGRLMGCCRNFWLDFGTNAFHDGLAASLDSPRLEIAKQMLQGRAEPVADIPCTTCDLYAGMRRDGNWISEKELNSAGGPPPTTFGAAIDPGDSEATHVDLFLVPGPLNRLMLASPPPSRRHRIGDPQTAAFLVEPGKQYTLYALPKRLDPEFRIPYAPLPAVTETFTASARPIAQEIRLRLA